MLIQELIEKDLSGIPDLQPAGWNGISPTISYYISSDFCFPIKIEIANELAGIGAAIIHNDVAWLAHIVVHEKHRNKGIGRTITESLVELSLKKGCKTVYLIATELGEPVYRKVGFETETNYLHFTELPTQTLFSESAKILPYASAFHQQILELDKATTGEDRSFHIETFLNGGFVYQTDKNIDGFYLPSFGDGLIMATSAEAGRELMRLRLSKSKNASFPEDNRVAAAFMDENNYKEYKLIKRMRLGESRKWVSKNIYNRVGGNLG